jgi:DNA-binding MurR/RpiR family transcriptional regulator
MQNTIFSKIQAKYSTFSPTHKKIADYICQNYIEMTYQSISEISKKSVSAPEASPISAK